MIKSIFPILISFLLGWTLHLLYAQSNQNNIKKVSTVHVQKADCSDYEDSITHEIVEKTVVKEVIKLVPKIVYREKKEKGEENNSTNDLFLLALAKKEFYDAMNYYEDADEEKHKEYQTALIGYFQAEQVKNLAKTIEQMQYFIEIDPESQKIVFQLAQLFEKLGAYRQALNIIIDFSYVASYEQTPLINTKIKSISIAYISKLNKSKNLKSLIEFLTNRINKGVLTEFYSFELAKAYLKLKKYIDSATLLEELKENDTYKERAIELLAFIQEKLEEQEEYPVQIPLIRDGSHFLVQAYADNIPVLLMIDTGASITSIDYNIVKHLNVQKENNLFHTAGGDIYETIFQAKSFTIGSLSLENFSISGSSFPSNDFNGLLGMNFLGQFKFKIDQKEAILFLGKKY